MKAAVQYVYSATWESIDLIVRAPLSYVQHKKSPRKRFILGAINISAHGKKFLFALSVIDLIESYTIHSDIIFPVIGAFKIPQKE